MTRSRTHCLADVTRELKAVSSHFGRKTQSMEQVIGIMIVIVVIGLLIDEPTTGRGTPAAPDGVTRRLYHD